MTEILDLEENFNFTPTQRNSTETKEINRIDYTECNYNEFYWNYMNRNWPVILTSVSEYLNWNCRRDWTKNLTNNETNKLSLPFYATMDDDDVNKINDNHREIHITAINFDYLKQKIDNRKVPIYDCSSKYFNSHQKSEMNFYDFLDYWRRCPHQENSDFNTNTNIENKILYLKDWHLQAQSPNYNFYQVPKHFASDWLNEHLLCTNKDDYRFVYMGPKNSWTPFHADVFGSYSWSTNIAGCKKWILLPPGEELKLTDNLGNLPFSIVEEQLKEKHVQHFIIYQEENEAIFVPSGWYHQVLNLTDTISINHNWFNACNIDTIYKNLKINMQQVIAEIDDCRQMDNFDEHCQTMLRASFGMNYDDFLDLLENIIERRLECCLKDNENNISITSNSCRRLFFNCYTLNDFHKRHDIKSIHFVLDDMLEDVVVCDSRTVLYRRCLRLENLTKNF